MKWEILVIIVSVILIAGCNTVGPDVDDNTPSGKSFQIKRSTMISSNIFIIPDPESMGGRTSDQPLKVGLYIENQDPEQGISDGIATLWDLTYSGSGGIDGVAYTNFDIGPKPEVGSSVKKMYPAGENIYFDSGLSDTIFESKIGFIVHEDFESDEFWIRRTYNEDTRAKGCENNCGTRNNLKTDSKIVTRINEEIFDLEDDDEQQMDSIFVSFSVSDMDCEIVKEDYLESYMVNPSQYTGDDIHNIFYDIRLENGQSLNCYVDYDESDEKGKLIICELDSILDTEDSYPTSVKGRFSYGCVLHLYTDKINFKLKEEKEEDEQW